MSAAEARAQGVGQMREAPRFLSPTQHVILRHLETPPQKSEAISIATPGVVPLPLLDIVKSGDPVPAPYSQYQFGGSLDAATDPDDTDLPRAGITFRGVVANGNHVAFYAAMVTNFNPNDPFRAAERIGVFRADVSTNPPTIEAIAVHGEPIADTVDLFPPDLASATWHIPRYDEPLDPTAPPDGLPSQSVPPRVQPLLGWVAPVAINESGWMAFRVNILIPSQQFPPGTYHGAIFAHAVSKNDLYTVAIENVPSFPLRAATEGILNTIPLLLGPPVINETGILAFYSVAGNAPIASSTGVFVADPPSPPQTSLHTTRSPLHSLQGTSGLTIGADAILGVPNDISPLTGGQESLKGGWFDQPSINCRGDIAFRALIDYDDESNFPFSSVVRWTRATANLEVLFQVSDPLPPLPDGSPVSPTAQIVESATPIVDNFESFSRPSINGMGEVAVVSQITPQFESCPNEEALLLWTREGEGVTLARTRSPQFEVFDEAAQTFYQIFAFGSYETGAADPYSARFFKGVALNDLGQVALPFVTTSAIGVDCPPAIDQFAGFGSAHRDRELEIAAWSLTIGSRLFSGGSSADGDSSLARFSGVGAYWSVSEIDLAIGGAVLPPGGLVADEPECPALIADINGDMCVHTADFGLLIGDFGCTGACIGDINGDGVVNTADLGLMVGYFGQECVGCACVEGSPESLMAGTGEAPSSPLLRELGFEDAASYVEWLHALTPGEVDRHLEECIQIINRADSAR